MSETLCTLRTKGGGGGAKQTETVLWTNGSPTSTFSAQTVTLSDSINNYDYIAINYAYGASSYISGEYCAKVIYSVVDFKKGTYNTSVRRPSMALGVQDPSSVPYYRSALYVSDTSIRFGSATSSGGQSSTNVDVPITIVGIKNMGGIRTNEKYDILPFKAVNAGTSASFTTKGEAKAIWLTFKPQSDTQCLTLTNVNPYTGEIDNNTIYRARTAALNTFDINLGSSFTVTNGTVSTTQLSGQYACWASLAYTY